MGTSDTGKEERWMSRKLQVDLEDVSFQYDQERVILHNIFLKIQEGESVGLIGANGVGKSTLLKLLVGLNLNYSGRIRVTDLPVEKKTLPQIRSQIGYVFQDSDSQLFMTTVYEDVAFAPRNYGLPEAEVEERVHTALELVGITHLQDRPIYKMSGGEKKLASIATILSMTPEVILMDEPSVALDPRNRKNLIRVLNSFHTTKIIASHDLDLILDTCERTVLMSEGRIVCEGPTREILMNQKLLEDNGLELPLSCSRQAAQRPGTGPQAP